MKFAAVPSELSTVCSVVGLIWTINKKDILTVSVEVYSVRITTYSVDVYSSRHIMKSGVSSHKSRSVVSAIKPSNIVSETIKS